MLSSGLRYRLLSGPYEPPRTHRGAHLFCELRGTVRVGGYSDGPIPWPVKWGTRSVIVCGALVGAVEKESEVAVAHHWGVSIKTAQKWRRGLGVGMYTSGTEMLQHTTALEHATPVRMRSLTALARRARAPKPKRWRRWMSEMVRRRIARQGPINPRQRLWTREEERLLGTKSDAELAVQLGRSPRAVLCRRRALGVDLTHQDWSAWTKAEERLLGTASDAEIARRLGRGERGVQLRRQMLGISQFGGTPGARPWKAEEVALLGTRPDREVARRLGRSLASVQARRLLKGIGSPAPLRKAWTPKEDRLLAVAGDEAVMKKTGRSWSAIANRRLVLGMRNPQPKRHFWTPEESALLGKVSDHEVARRVGCSLSTVRARRAWLGIPAPEKYG